MTDLFPIKLKTTSKPTQVGEFSRAIQALGNESEILLQYGEVDKPIDKMTRLTVIMKDGSEVKCRMIKECTYATYKDTNEVFEVNGGIAIRELKLEVLS